MTTESFTILTKVGSGHRESKVIIDWEGISEQDLKILATQALKHNIQATLRKNWQAGDEVIYVQARDAVNHSSHSRFTDLSFLEFLDRTPEDRMLPSSKSQRRNKDSSSNTDLETLLSMLSAADLKALLTETN